MGMRKPTRNLVKIARVLAEIQTEHLPDTSITSRILE
jgi:hypothetical protein